VGLATATAVGAWINFGLLCLLAIRQGSMRPDATLAKVGVAVAAAAALLFGVAIFGDAPAARLAGAFGRFSTEAHLVFLAGAGSAVYAFVLLIGLRGLGVRLARAKGVPASAVDADQAAPLSDVAG
jgi:putative peptidoglycan lipid II flippase